MSYIARFNGTTSYLQTSVDFNAHGVWGLTTYLYDIDNFIIYSGGNGVVRLLGKDTSYTNYLLLSDTAVTIRYDDTNTVIPITAIPKDTHCNLKIRRSGDLHEVLINDVPIGSVSSSNQTNSHLYNNRIGFIGVTTTSSEWGFGRFSFYSTSDGSNAARVDWNAETSSHVASPFILTDDSTSFSAHATGTDMVWEDISTVSLPIADAGLTQAVIINTIATLDASGSVDTNVTGNLTYLWTQTSGTAVTLSDNTIVNPTFTPVAYDTYGFELVVNDGNVSSNPSTTILGVPEFGGIERFAGVRLGEVISTPSSMPTSEEGIYFPCIIPTNDIPDSNFPAKFTYVCYSSSAHSTGAGGIYLSLCEGNPTIAANWIDYDDAVANGDFDYLGSKPASNPIYVDTVHGAQTETPYLNNVNGVLFMTYHNDANISFIRNSQNTCLAKSNDGINFTRFNVSGNTNGNLLTYDPENTIGDGHTGYFRWGTNPFTEIPFNYVGYSIIGGSTWAMSGLWVSDDAENWSLHETYSKTAGNATKNIPEAYDTVASILFEPKNIIPLGDGTYRAVASIRDFTAGTQGLKEARLCEVLVASDGHTILTEFNQFFKGVTGEFDEQDIRSDSSFEYNGNTYIAYTGAITVSSTIFNNVGMLQLTQENGYLTMLKPYDISETDIDFKSINNLPNDIAFYNPNNDCSYSFTANGLEVVVAAGSVAGFYSVNSVDLSTSSIIDLFLTDTYWTDYKESKIGIGFYSDIDNLATTPKFAIANNETTKSNIVLYTSDSSALNTSLSTLTAVGYNDDYLNRDWESIKAPKDLGIRAIPTQNKVCFLASGKNELETITGDFSTGTLQALVRFINNDSTSSTAVVGGLSFGDTEKYYTAKVVYDFSSTISITPLNNALLSKEINYQHETVQDIVLESMFINSTQTLYDFYSTISITPLNNALLTKEINYQHETVQDIVLESMFINSTQTLFNFSSTISITPLNNALLTKEINYQHEKQQSINLTAYFDNPTIPLNNYKFRIDGEIVTQNINCENLYQNRDQEFVTEIKTGESAAEFIAAKYELFEEFAFKPFLTKTIGNGIVLVGDEFKTTINKAELPKAGMFYHQFTVSNQLNQELPPIFSGLVKIKEVR